MGAQVEHVDAVVVGSGFGASVSAFRLAEAGRSVVVLERGRAYPPGSFARSPYEMSHAFWEPKDELFGLFDIRSFRKIEGIVSAGHEFVMGSFTDERMPVGMWDALDAVVLTGFTRKTRLEALDTVSSQISLIDASLDGASWRHVRRWSPHGRSTVEPSSLGVRLLLPPEHSLRRVGRFGRPPE